MPNGKVLAASMCEERSCAAGGANVCAGDYGQGCGIVEFETADSAAEAINTLHLSEVRLKRLLLFLAEWWREPARSRAFWHLVRLCFTVIALNFVSRPPTWPQSPSIRCTCPCSTGLYWRWVGGRGKQSRHCAYSPQSCSCSWIGMRCTCAMRIVVRYLGVHDNPASAFKAEWA